MAALYLLAVLVAFFLMFRLLEKGTWRKDQARAQRRVTLATVACPTCHTVGKVTNISGASKVGSAATVGVFSLGKLSKSMQCRACGARW